MPFRHLLAFPFLAVLAAGTTAQGKSPDPTKPVQEAAEPVQDPDVIVVTATRLGQDPFELPYATSQLASGRIRHQLQSRSTPEILKQVPGISVQKTAHGQGSPKFRGQTGFQTLLLVDGIRINDSTWRSGNVEYWNHVDPYSFDRFEVLLGPAAALWGSDAVAGVGQAFTRRNKSFDPGLHIHRPHPAAIRHGRRLGHRARRDVWQPRRLRLALRILLQGLRRPRGWPGRR